VAGGTDEVQAGVHAEIDLIAAFWLLLLQHERFVLVVKEFDNRLPRVTIVDIVAESRRVNNGQADWYHQRRLASAAEGAIPLKNFSSSSALVISISTVLSICFVWRRLWSA